MKFWTIFTGTHHTYSSIHKMSFMKNSHLKVVIDKLYQKYSILSDCTDHTRCHPGLLQNHEAPNARRHCKWARALFDYVFECRNFIHFYCFLTFLWSLQIGYYCSLEGRKSSYEIISSKKLIFSSIPGFSFYISHRGRSFGLSRWCWLAGKFPLNWPFE